MVIICGTEAQPTRSYPVSIRQMEPEIKHLQIPIFISVPFLYYFYNGLAAGDCLRDGSVYSTGSSPVSIRQMKPEIKYLQIPKYISFHFLSDSYTSLDIGDSVRWNCKIYPILSDFYWKNGTRN